MTDKRQRRVAEFIKPFRVKPGSKVILEKDFDPAFKGGVKKKKEGVALLSEGVRLLSEYQARLAAQRTRGGAGGVAGAGHRRKGRDDPPRNERGEPAGRCSAQLQVPSAEELNHEARAEQFGRRNAVEGKLLLKLRLHTWSPSANSQTNSQGNPS